MNDFRTERKVAKTSRSSRSIKPQTAASSIRHDHIYAGSAAFARGDITRAESFARKALECSEGCVDEAYFNLGGYLLAQKRYGEARICYVRAIEMDPDYEIAKDRLEDLDRLLKYQEGEQVFTNA